MNVDAWTIFGTLGNMAAQQFGLGAYHLEALTEGWDGDARADLVARLGLIAYTLQPADSSE